MVLQLLQTVSYPLQGLGLRFTKQLTPFRNKVNLHLVRSILSTYYYPKISSK